MDIEEFGASTKYEEVNRKCFCCGRMIPGEVFEKSTGGTVREYCSQDCIKVYAKYREPYLEG